MCLGPIILVPGIQEGLDERGREGHWKASKAGMRCLDLLQKGRGAIMDS